MSKIGKILPVALKTLFTKPSTEAYPYVKKLVEDDFRGKLEFNCDVCIGCNICTRVCPAKAITIEKVEGEEKKFKAIVHLDRCIYCAQCVDSCPKKALKTTQAFELAGFETGNMTVEV
ncbi:MAG: hypothetical protein BGN88_08210 [Clostridiales bacterium 43-6]|nr:MAG: hypothetical protein BGN88_08210 [Clostridiales bacterium 43-6]